ncbi:MAG: hypothetical protein HY746_09935 [Elusimicrobia bacterium]|nr:hypothetical protein [Elusimicrobiota bacterium]
MKNIKITFAACVMFLSCLPAAAKKDKSSEEMVLPDVELIDIPTAGILDYYGFLVKTRFFSDGAVLGSLNFGVMERLNFGSTMIIEKIVGSDSPVKMVHPEIQIKFRFYDGGYYIPALALGYDGQGYYYNRATKKYMEKEKGLYLAASKELLFSGFFAHGGLNMADFDDNVVYAFLGANYTLEDKISFMLELDSMWHDEESSRFNTGVRMFLTPDLHMDLALREVGRDKVFPNGWPRKSERIVQIRYNTSF